MPNNVTLTSRQGYVSLTLTNVIGSKVTHTCVPGQKGERTQMDTTLQTRNQHRSTVMRLTHK